MKTNKTIKFTGEYLQKFSQNDGENPDFPNWYFSSNKNEGEYDSEHGAMVDYPLYMFNDETGESYESVGGYYNEGAGECYDYTNTPFTFVEVREVTPLKGKKGKKYFEATLSVKIFTEDNKDNEISWEEAEKIAKSLSCEKFEVKDVNFGEDEGYEE